MKFTVDAHELKRAITYLSPVININSPNIGLRHICIKHLGTNSVEIKAFNEHTNASYFMTVSDLEGEAEAYVLGRTFFAIAKSLNGNVNISIKKRVNFTCGRSKYNIQTLDPEAFQALKVPQLNYSDAPFDNHFKLSGFQTRLKSVSHCLSTDDTRMDLQHVFIQQREADKCLMMACDGVQGSLVECPPDYGRLDGFMLYSDIVGAILSVTNSNELSFRLDGNILYTKIGKFLSASSVIDTEYPVDLVYGLYEKSLADNHVLDVVVDEETTKDALNRLLLLVDPTESSIKVKFEAENMIMSVDENDSGEEVVALVDDNSPNSKELCIYIDGKRFKESLSRTIGEVTWRTPGAGDLQYICDSECTQFFFGLIK